MLYRKLYEVLVKERVLTNKNENIIIETLKNLAELMVYGDKHSERFFEFFCEKNCLAHFLAICRQVGPLCLTPIRSHYLIYSLKIVTAWIQQSQDSGDTNGLDSHAEYIKRSLSILSAIE